MNTVTFTDGRGRNYEVILPPNVENPENGIVVGPYDVVDMLHYPEPFASRLHNELHARGILTKEDLVKKSSELAAALKAALVVDVQALSEAFHQYSKESLLTEKEVSHG